MRMIALFKQFGWGEILLVLGIALLLFGTKKLPEIGRSLGKGLREFKTGVKGFGDDVREGMEDDDQSPQPNANGRKA